MVAVAADIHPAVVAAIVENAERQAIMVVGFLQAIDQRLKSDGFSSGASGLPLGFLLELGALCQLKLWDEEGLRGFLPSLLPTFAEASEDLGCRVKEAPESFKSLTGDRLGPRVLQVWLERFAWAAPNLLQADVVLGEVDEDALVDALAQLLWEHRHDTAGQNPAD